MIAAAPTCSEPAHDVLRHGLGTNLLKQFVQVGRDEKLERITATVLTDHLEMQRVARKAGFKLEHVPGENRYDAKLVL